MNFGGPLFWYFMVLLLFLGRVGRHQLIELCVSGKTVGERYDIARTANQPAACGDVGDVAKLVVGDVQQLRQLLAVGGARSSISVRIVSASGGFRSISVSSISSRK